MLEHTPPYTRIGAHSSGWIELCANCMLKVRPLLNPYHLKQVAELNQRMLERVDRRFAEGEAAEEESLLRGVFAQFAKVDIDKLAEGLEIHELGHEGECLFESFEPSAGQDKESIRAQALADRLRAAYRDLLKPEDRNFLL